MVKIATLLSSFLACVYVLQAAETFTLATFNIRCPIDKTPHSWQERKERCIAVINQNKFDIFGVQEATKQQIDDLIANKVYKYIGGGRDDFKDQGEHSAILYRQERFTLLQGGTFGLSEKPEVPGFISWNARCPRIATWGLFKDKKDGKKFIYYNTHLDHISEEARIKGIALLVDHARKNMPGLPLIISGDFNTRPDSQTYKSAADLLFDSAKITQTPHTGPLGTFHGFGKYNVKYPIDYIFVSKEFKVLSHRTDNTRFPAGYASDHYPVIVKISLQ